ncbi:MAG: SusC/RagA family TonB-linked outer membrane protein, partial [Paludibacter sp.]
MRKTMKVIFLTLAFYCLSATAFSQSITLNMNNITVKEAIQILKDKTGYSFVYEVNDIDTQRKISVKASSKSIDEVVKQMLAGQKVSYIIQGKNIVVTRDQKSTSETTEINSQKSKKIIGKVTDESGNPLPGVSVVVKSTRKGTTTDSNGFYSFEEIPENAILQISFIGMKSKDVNITGKKDINVVLEDGSIELDEVVAIGYGTARKRDLIGSVSSVSGSTLKDIPVSSAAQAIVGRMAGVQVTKTEGSPDAEMKIRVRGGGSLTQDNSPLYIVDGFPVTTINDIAPTDIATIDVLKDASSTAIYGARGANGVILITTKGGYEGKAKVSYNMYYGMKQITKTLPVLSPYEYVLYQREITQDMYFDKYFGAAQDMNLYKQMTGTNWQDDVFGQTGTSLYNNIAVTGGSKTSKYNISLTQNDDKEIMLGNATSRTNFTAKTTNKINDWLTLDLNTRMSDASIDGAGTSANYRLADAIQFRPINGLMDFVDYSLTSTDYEAASAFVLNPVKQTNDDYRHSKSLTFNFNAAATIQITKELNYRFEYGTQYGDITNNRFYGLNTWNVMNYGSQPIASIQKTSAKSYRLANTLNFIKRDFLPGSNINAMIGEELNSYKTFDETSSAKYFPKYIDAVSALSMMNLGTPDPILTGDNPDVKTSSFFGRVMYDFKGKYLATATLRADGSSKFAPGNQWGYFPSVGLAWRISDEDFLKAAKENWLSDLKLRASYGESGNNRISDNAWQKVYNVKTDAYYADGNETSPTPLLVPSSILSNPKLKWETTITRNIGVDFSFFKQRLSGSVEGYQNTTRDLLIQATVPSSTGYAIQWQNVGQTSNQGLEIVLNGVL